MKNFYDVVVIGGGPAGLTAAIYLARAKYRVVVVEKEKFGGQITITHEVVNYPGVERTSGAELTETMRRQAEHFGAEFMLAEVEKLDLSGDVKMVHTARGQLKCFGVLLATGAHPRMIGFPGEAEFRGRGVAYCATCDGEFFTGKEVFVIGGGFAAAEEAVFLTKYAKHVNILMITDDFTCAQSVAEEAKKHPKITVRYNTVVEEVSGDSALRAIRYRNDLTGEVIPVTDGPESRITGDFLYHGVIPNSDLGMLLCFLCHTLGTGEVIGDHQDIHMFGILGQEHRFFGRGKTAADHKDFLAGEEFAVTGGAVGHASAPELCFAGETDHSGMGTGGQQHAEALQLPTGGMNHLHIARQIQLFHFCQHKLCAEVFCLAAHGLS